MSHPHVNEKLLEMVMHRSAVDRTFRRQLLADPAAALHTAFGVTLPHGFRIRFVETGPDLDLLVVLPDPVGEDELSDDDLEQVAGGTGNPAAWGGPTDPPPPGGGG